MSATRFDRISTRALRSALVVVATLGAAAVVAPRATLYDALLVAGVVGAVALVAQPGLGLVALAALSFALPLDIGTGSEVSLTAPVLLIPAVGVAWLAAGMYQRSLSLRLSRAALPLLLFVGSSLLSLWAGTWYWDPGVLRPGNLLLVQLGQCAIYALSAATFLLAGELGSRGTWLERATFAFLAVAGVVVVQYLVPKLWSIGGWSVAGQANTAMLWGWLAAMAMGQLVCNRRLTRGARAWLVILLVGAAYVVWVKQRTWVSGWLPFTMGAVAVLWLRIRQRRVAVALLVGVLLVVAAVLAYPWVFEHAGGQSEMDASLGGRMLLYQRTLELVKDHPVLGLGPAAYRHYGMVQWLSLGPGRALYERPLVSSHNNYLDIYAQMGLVGLGIFLWFLFEVGRMGWRLLDRFRGDFDEGYVMGAVGGLAATLVAMVLVDWFLPFVYNVGFAGFRTSAVAWTFLGGLVALEHKAQRGIAPQGTQ